MITIFSAMTIVQACKRLFKLAICWNMEMFSLQYQDKFAPSEIRFYNDSQPTNDGSISWHREHSRHLETEQELINEIKYAELSTLHRTFISSFNKLWSTCASFMQFIVQCNRQSPFLDMFHVKWARVGFSYVNARFHITEDVVLELPLR